MTTASERRWQLPLAICAISWGAPFAHAAQPAPPLAIAAVRAAASSLLLLAAGRRELPSLARLAARERALVAASGLLLAAHFGAWIGSLALTSTAASVSLVTTSPIFAALFGALLGDRPARREWLGIAVACAGCALLAGNDWHAGGTALVGDGLALVGAVAAAGYLIVGRRLRAALPLLPYLGAVNAVAAVALIAAATIAGDSVLALPATSYAACAGGAIVASFIGHSLLNAAVRTTPAHLVSLAVLGEPIGSSLIMWAIYGEQPQPIAALASAIVLAGIGVGFAGKRPR